VVAACFVPAAGLWCDSHQSDHVRSETHVSHQGAAAPIFGHLPHYYSLLATAPFGGLPRFSGLAPGFAFVL
jgi:hypothetical protein